MPNRLSFLLVATVRTIVIIETNRLRIRRRLLDVGPAHHAFFVGGVHAFQASKVSRAHSGTIVSTIKSLLALFLRLFVACGSVDAAVEDLADVVVVDASGDGSLLEDESSCVAGGCSCRV